MADVLSQILFSFIIKPGLSQILMIWVCAIDIFINSKNRTYSYYKVLNALFCIFEKQNQDIVVKPSSNAYKLPQFWQ